jgi:REP-associated tyrosine transposase
LLGRRYVRHVNATYRRSLTLREGRYRALPIDSEAYFLACCRYIELNPVRAGVVARARDYTWSSYGAHGLGRSDPLVADHPLYRALGGTPALRQQAYRALFRPALDADFVTAPRAATNDGWALGDRRFKDEIAAAIGRRAAPLPKGRPAKAAKDPRQISLL